MAEFWPENQSEPSSVRIVKPSSSANLAVTDSESSGEDSPTILSSFRPSSASAAQPISVLAGELAGEMLAHFRLDDYVGVGGMGAVFRATDIRLDRPVALKILPPEQAVDAEIVARFQQEARAAARLDHENVARVFFVGEDRGLHFIAFEYVDGVNIRDLIQQCGSLMPHEVVNYALQISGALVHAALRGVVHRDIKPSNIIITSTGRAKLVDMGLARNFERRHDGGLTQSGVTLGTFDYISPEQARDPRSADVRSDIYSFGCTLYHMLTGRPPYPEGTVLQKLLKHQEDAPPDPRDANPAVPENVAAVVTRMMAKDPGRRYQAPQELLTELLEIAANMGLKSSSPEGLIWVAEPTRSPMTRITWTVWLSAAASLVLAVFVIYGRPGAESGIDESGSSVHQSSPPQMEIGSADITQATGADKSQIQQPPSAEFSAGLSGKPPEESTARVAETRLPSILPAIEPSTSSAEVIAVNGDQEFKAAIEQAPSGSVIEINGEYRPQKLHRVDDTAGIRMDGKRLTIKAAPGTQPRMLLSHDDQAVGVTDWTLLTLVGSQVEFEGIRFEISGETSNLPLMTILSLESSQVTLRRCSFFHSLGQNNPGMANRSGEPQIWVAHLDSGIGTSGQVFASKVTATDCFFGGGDGGFYLDGPAKLDLSECTMLPYRSPIRVRSLGFPQSMAAEIRLANVSLFGGGNPVFDLEFARVSVLSQDTVFTHEAPTQGVLARVDSDSRIDWKGRRDLYHGLKQFLVKRLAGELVPLASRLSDWMELSQEVDDKDSVETEKSPWLITLGEAANKSRSEVADAFRLAHDSRDPAWRPVGARYALPWGPLYSIAQADMPPLTKRAIDSSTASSSQPSAAETPRRQASKDSKLDMNKIMNETPPVDASTSGAGVAASNSVSGSDANSSQVTGENTLIVDPQIRSAFHSLAAACAKAEDGAVIEIRHQGKLREPPIELGDRHLMIRAAPGCRPVIELAVDPLERRGREPRMFDIRRGSLTLRDLDLRVVSDEAVGAEGWTVIASRGADVTLERCSVTVHAAPGVPTTIARFLASEMDEPMLAPMTELNSTRSQLQLHNSMVVGASILVRIQPTVRVRVELENCVTELQDQLFSLTGGTERTMPGAVNELEIRHSTIKTHRGMVNCEASETRPWLPQLEVTAVDNVFVGVEGSPWLRFKSPKPTDELRGLLRWKGMNNSYDGQETMWEIESMNSGNDLERYDWTGWLSSPARDEVKADRVQANFLELADAAKPWNRTRSHFKLSPSRIDMGPASDGGSRGADISLIPPPPQEREPE